MDKDHKNNEKANLVPLCASCHYKTHRLIKPLLKRFFGLMLKDRYTYSDIAGLFYTSKQNVYSILTRKGYVGEEKLSTE